MAGETIVGWVDSIGFARRQASRLEALVQWVLSAPVNGIEGGAEYFAYDPTLSQFDIDAILRSNLAATVTAATGQAFTDSDVRGFHANRSGVVTVGLLDLTKAVSFSRVMPSSSYRVFLQPLGNLNAVFWPSLPLAGGFTLNLSVGVAGDFNYLAVEI